MVSIGAAIQLILHSQALHIRTCHQALGDVYPHTQLGSVLAVGNVTKNSLSLNVEEHGVAPLGESGVRVVNFQPQSVLTLLDLTAISNRGQEGASGVIFAVVTAGEQSTFSDAVGSQPFANLLLSHPVGDITILEVPHNLRTLTELNIQYGAAEICVLIGGGDLGTGLGLILGSCINQAIQRTGSGIGHGPCKVCSIESDIELTVSSHNFQGNALAVRNYGAILSERYRLRVNDMDGLGTNHLVVIDHLDGRVTNLTIGGEYAVSHRTEASICQGPGCICGDLSLGTGEVTTHGLNLYDGVGYIVIVLGLHVCVIKLTGRRSGRDEDDTVCVLSKSTITRRTVHCQVLAGTLRHEGGGSTTIAVCCIYAASCNHDLCTFIHIHSE